MRKRTLISSAIAVTAAGAITIAGTVVAQAQETGDEALAAAIDAILTDKRLTDSQVGVTVADANTGEVLYERNGAKRAIPGSNDKLTTTAAALEQLGGDFTYTTEVLGDRPTDGVIAGDLYLRGSGDPTLLEADYDRMAEDLADLGVSMVDGDLVADDTAFDPVRSGAEWGWSDLQFTYAAEVSALTVASGDDFNAGSVRVFIKPGAAEGDPAQLSMAPANDYVEIVNTATTGTTTNVSVNRDPHDNVIRVSGTVKAGTSGTYATRAVIEPTQLAADVFADSLADAGITVNGELRFGETTPQGPESLATHQSMTLAELTPVVLKPSNASVAEALFKTLGYEATGTGTFATGKAATYAGIEPYGVDTGPIRQVDGSGISRHNMMTSNMLADLLVGAKQADWFGTWYDSLPIACQDGTLASRMCATPAAGNVRAKTGSMTSVSALSGYVTDADGREFVFSVIVNDFLYSTVKDIEDKIAAAIAAHTTAATEAETLRSANVDDIEMPAEDPNHSLECTWVEPAVC
ncbi:D-alanyl-D-alanine carboxypeptidase/D-alanyl-D-alanine-endopeptidase [Glycomyces algeriensis]|uniref:D-alanyl-D-alanine carboxypeptidase DacC n=1 Tax=Glycomyces algeriensis TaxID=256037 RepID=A0A9W6G6F8_9ACTN|nr:D-alanyl-D-alanine carboxypeptidase/D-alanyl-D-alanine-endopeptidase [Glycomyces algeriensis]MDA1366328.1 D-alanyl-D-alanine carboxypeptidase/D-alanyl-D-alanine-endopeptidase [Glycomyces algeriensis]MDR7348674.1 D-alanyl-D-alanine carboxypeptidase/D-alanyl-D-alanine-endopeptidase (penicillin-binding protein 4) [Glycomyces algeriensis]GLI41376.1 D-alanyl-D-alanine carboxypeptidase DacC [Glycomyces algeriensis]